MTHADGDAGSPRFDEAPEHGAGGPACTEQHHALLRQREACACKTREKSRDIGIEAHESAVFLHDCVHRADDLRVLVDFIEQVDHRLLVRYGHVPATETQRAQTGDGRCEVYWLHRQCGINVVNPSLGEGRVLHRRREGMRDRPAHDAEISSLSSQHLHPPQPCCLRVS